MLAGDRMWIDEPHARRGDDRQRDEGDVERAREVPLVDQAEALVDPPRVGDDGRDRRRVRERVEPVRGATLEGDPVLHERTGRREQDEHRTGVHGEQGEDGDDRVGAGVWTRGGVRQKPGSRERRQQQGTVDQRLLARTAPRQRVRVEVPEEQRDLEEAEADREDAGAAAEPRQQRASGDRLHEEEEERGEGDRRRVDDHASRSPPASRSSRRRWRSSVRRSTPPSTAATAPSAVPPAIQNMISIW